MKLRIEKAIYGGAGLARDGGKAVFVPFTLPGETVEARIAEENRGYATAELTSVTEPGGGRVQPGCPYFTQCGGCHYQHAAYAAQVEMKRAILRETLERARVAEAPEIEAVTGEPWGYRNRIRLHVQADPFRLCYKRRNSHANLPVAVCPIAAPALGEALEICNREGAGLGLSGWVTEMEFFAAGDGGPMLLSLWTERTGQEAAREAGRGLAACWPRLQELLPELAGAAVFASDRKQRSTRMVAQTGETSLLYGAGGRVYRVSLGSFFQVNRFLTEPLVELVTGEAGGGTAWDLYAGVGLFSLALRERFREVVAVESAPGSVRDLQHNLQGGRAVAAETATFLRRAVEQRQEAPDVVVVDPPRAGLGDEVTSLLGKLRPRAITYVSCDPATLSRDLYALLDSGYRLRRMHLVDLFPQTFHMESVTHLALT